MLVSWQLLQKFVQPSKAVSDKELMETLTMSVVEVENVLNQAAKLDKIVVGQVTEVYAHPGADKLKMAKVDIGRETVSIVCGGVTCYSHSVLSVNSVAAKNLEAYTIYRGNPAQAVKERIIE